MLASMCIPNIQLNLFVYSIRSVFKSQKEAAVFPNVRFYHNICVSNFMQNSRINALHSNFKIKTIQAKAFKDSFDFMLRLLKITKKRNQY